MKESPANKRPRSREHAWGNGAQLRDKQEGGRERGRGTSLPLLHRHVKRLQFLSAAAPLQSSCRQSVANLLSLESSLRIRVISGLPISRSSGPVAPSGRTWRCFLPPGDGCRTKQTQVFAGPILVPGQRELSPSSFHENTAPTGEQHFLQLFALLSLLPLPPSQAAYPIFPPSTPLPLPPLE